MATKTRETWTNGALISTETVEIPPTETNEATIRDAAAAAFIANRTYVALAAPTAAQTTAQVKALSRQMNGVLRLVLQDFSGTD